MFKIICNFLANRWLQSISTVAFFPPSASEEIFNSIVLMYFQIFEIACWRGKKQILSLRINIFVSWNKVFNVQQRLLAWQKQASLKSEVQNSN